MRTFVCLIASLMLTVACAEDTATDSSTAAGSGLGGKLDEGAAGDVIVGSDTLVDSDALTSSDGVAISDSFSDSLAGMGDSAIVEGDTALAGDGAEPVEDMWAIARDVTVHHVIFPEGSEVPATYDSPYAPGVGFSLGGTEFLPKGSGGENPTYSFYDGSDNGKRCMYASARRWEAIMAVVPEALVDLKAESAWSGSFFNWNDDYSNDSWGDGNGARLWAWRTSLVKWISQTNNDGSCFLPTLEMVETLAAECMEKAQNSDGEIQGCSAYAPDPMD